MRRAALFVGCIALAAIVPGSAGAQTLPSAAEAAESSRAAVGTIVVAHGGSEEWNAPVFRIARAAETGGPVEVALLMGDAVPEYRFQDAARKLVERGAERIVVVPLLASSHSSHYEQIRWLAGEREELEPHLIRHLHEGRIERPSAGVPMTLTRALDASMEIASILAERAHALAEAPAAQAMFIIGHGPSSAEDYAEWMRHLRPVADSIRVLTSFRDVKLGLVRDDAPDEVRAEAVRRIREIIQLQAEMTGRDVAVVPVLVSRGYISTRKLPADLEGLPIRYDGEGLLPHPGIARWIERRVREGTGLVADAGMSRGSASPASAGASVRYEGTRAEPAELSLARGEALEIRNDANQVLVFEGNGLYPGEVAVSPGATVTVSATGSPGTYRLVDERGQSGTAVILLAAGSKTDPLLERKNAAGALTVLEGHVRAASALHRRALSGESPHAADDFARAGTHAGHPWNELLRGDEPDALELQGLLRENGLFESLDHALAVFVAGAGDEGVSVQELDGRYDAVLATVERARSAIAGGEGEYRRSSFRADVVGFVLETAAAEYATSAEGGTIAARLAGSPGRDDYVEYQDARAFVAAARELVEPLRPGMTPEGRQAFDSLDRVVFRTLDPPAPEAPLHPDIVRAVVNSVLESLPRENR